MTRTMRNRILLTGWAMLILCSASLAQTLPSSLRIVVLGSSSAAGEGASTDDSAWVWRYAAYLKTINPGYEVINLAKSSYNSYHLQANGFLPPEGRSDPDTSRNITMALSLHPDAIILNLPSNDATWEMSLIEQTENFNRISNEAIAAAVPVWVTTTQPRNLSEPRRQNLITMRDWIGMRFGSNAIDFWTGVATENGLILDSMDCGDGIHLNDQAHALLAERTRNAGIPERIASARTIAVPAPQPLPEMEFRSSPAENRVSVRVELGTPGEFTFLLYDFSGKRVRDLHRGASHGGEVRFSLPPGLSPGTYPWVLLAGGRVRAGRLNVGH